MLSFTSPAIADKPRADAALQNTDGINILPCDMSFGNLFCWRNYYHTRFAFENGFFFVKAESDGMPFYLFPAGHGDFGAAVESLLQDARTTRTNGSKPLFYCLTKEMCEKLEQAMPGRFVFTPRRDNFDYVYNAADLITLKGKKYHGKRNHLAHFAALGEAGYEPIGEENLEECHQMNEEWCKINGCDKNITLSAEACAVGQAFRNFHELGYAGGLLRLNGRIVAYSMGEPLTQDTFVVHIEKAFADVEGAYTAINREFAAHFCEGYAFVNREDDVGEEGLRRAKMSYNPALLLEKYSAELSEG